MGAAVHARVRTTRRTTADMFILAHVLLLEGLASASRNAAFRCWARTSRSAAAPARCAPPSPT